MEDEQRQVSIRKNGHTFIFRYPKHREGDMIETWTDMASDNYLGFDYWDAAAMCYQIEPKEPEMKKGGTQ